MGHPSTQVIRSWTRRHRVSYILRRPVSDRQGETHETDHDGEGQAWAKIENWKGREINQIARWRHPWSRIEKLLSCCLSAYPTKTWHGCLDFPQMRSWPKVELSVPETAFTVQAKPFLELFIRNQQDCSHCEHSPCPRLPRMIARNEW